MEVGEGEALHPNSIMKGDGCSSGVVGASTAPLVTAVTGALLMAKCSAEEASTAVDMIGSRTESCLGGGGGFLGRVIIDS